MPELPEVENVRRGLNTYARGHQVQKVWVGWPPIIEKPALERFKELMVGEKLEEVDRRGKYLIFYWTHWAWLAHLRMEGKFLLVAAETDEDAYTHLRFSLDDDLKLLYRDVRKFGRLKAFPREETDAEVLALGLGPEPEALTVPYLKTEFQKTSRNIKAVLLDQHVLAGIGNIYADEILFQTGLHPATPARALRDSQVAVLLKHIQSVLKAAIKAGGTTVRTYANSFGRAGQYQHQLQVYGRAGEPCLVCKSPLVKEKIAGRGTTFCPHCQKPMI